VFFVYAMRRIDCKSCGVRVELVPWADGKKRITKTFGWFLATWAKRLSWKETAEAFQTSWDTVFRAVEVAVEWGRARMDLSGITALGVDEIMWRRGHDYLTVVYQIDAHCKRLLWIGQHRSEETIKAFFTWLTPERAMGLKYICSDMWKPYLTVIAKRASMAIHVLDRFHIMTHFSKAIDEVRADEAGKLVLLGEDRPDELAISGESRVHESDATRLSRRCDRNCVFGTWQT
jgi:transposase